MDRSFNLNTMEKKIYESQSYFEDQIMNKMENKINVSFIQWIETR